MLPLIGTLFVASSTILAPSSFNSFIANTATQAIVESSTAENLGMEISQVAEKFRISSTTLKNLVKSESQNDPNAIGDHGCSYGLVQINTCAHPDVKKADALDPIFALSYAAKAISAGTEDQWTSCSCVKYASILARGIPLKDADKFYPNIVNPRVGALALFRYPSGVAHVAVITAIRANSFTVQEANYHHCQTGTREVSAYDSSLIGFWGS